MTKTFATIALGCAAFAAGVAQAQWLGPVWETNTILTADDLDMIRTTVQRNVHGKRADTVATWTNPASGNSGTITLLRKFAWRGLGCEQIEYQIRSGRAATRPERYVFRSCQMPDGSWKLV